MSTTVVPADDDSRGCWDDFVRSCPDSHLAHLWGWREVVERCFGHTPCYLAAKSGDELMGVLPLFHFKSFIFGSSLIALPYLNGGGVLAKDNEAKHLLMEEAVKLSEKLKVNYLELRQRENLSEGKVALKKRDHKATVVLPLKETSAEVFNSFPSKLRSQIRRPKKSGIKVSWCCGSDGRIESYLNLFYTVFSRHMRDLGTPVYPKRLFKLTAEVFGSKAVVFIARQGKRAVSCGFTVSHNETVEILWASSLKKYHRLSPNMALYWKAVKYACNEGYKYFDFGRASYGSGSMAFKLQWGGEQLALPWYYYVRKGELPDVSSASRRFSLASAVWRKLPVAAANLVGPALTSNIP